MNRRDYLKKKAVKTNSTACHNAYKSVRNEINKKIMYAKRITRQIVLTKSEIMQLLIKTLDRQIYQTEYFK
jgi:hypothetical protein